LKGRAKRRERANGSGRGTGGGVPKRKAKLAGLGNVAFATGGLRNLKKPQKKTMLEKGVGELRDPFAISEGERYYWQKRRKDQLGVLRVSAATLARQCKGKGVKEGR